jgi:hypothetical protein
MPQNVPLKKTMETTYIFMETYKCTFKVTSLQIHANFLENFKIVFKSIILWSNQKESIYTLSMALPSCKLPKNGQNMHRKPLLL